MAPNEKLAALSAAGVSIWLDDLSRERLTSGNLKELITDKSVVGVTTNPTIFAAALANGEAYDSQVRELKQRGASVDDVVREVTVTDVREACDVFRHLGGQRGRRRPRVAGGQPAARPRHRRHPGRGPRHLQGRRPAQPAGEDPGDPGGPVRDHQRARRGRQRERHADLLGGALPRRDDRLHGGPGAGRGERQNLGGIASVASFFVSRVDSEIDKRLEKIGTDEALALRGKAGIANSRLAYAAFEEAFQGKRWAALTAQGAKPQRPLWPRPG